MTRLLCFAGVVTAIFALGTVTFGDEPNPRPVLNAQPGAVIWTTATGFIGLPA